MSISNVSRAAAASLLRSYDKRMWSKQGEV